MRGVAEPLVAGVRQRLAAARGLRLDEAPRVVRINLDPVVVAVLGDAVPRGRADEAGGHACVGGRRWRRCFCSRST